MSKSIKVISVLIYLFLLGCSNHKINVEDQNSQAVAKLISLGLEAEKSERGVIIYLPPEINFEESKSDIDLKARGKIAEISSELNKRYLLNRSIEVSGHANSNGESEVNMEISKNRAQAVAEELVFSNVLLSRLIITWHGEEKPRFPEFDAQGKRIQENLDMNRRVQLIVLNPDEN